MMMIISRKNIRFDKMLSCCSGENSPWETNKREDNTAAAILEERIFSTPRAKKAPLLFWRHVRRVGKRMRCSSLCRRIHRLRVGSQTMETVGIFVASRKNNGDARLSLPHPSQPLPREKQRSSSAYQRLLYLFRAFRRVSMSKCCGGRERERGTSPPPFVVASL